MRHTQATTRRSRGFTLIEVLVALFIVSVGLLGLAGMKTASLRANYGSYNRTQVINLTYDMVDRMRANRAAAVNGDYDRSFGDPLPACGATVADCDVRQWLDELQDGLTNADGEIQVLDAATGLVVVRTRWDRSREEELMGGTGTDVTFEVRTRL